MSKRNKQTTLLNSWRNSEQQNQGKSEVLKEDDYKDCDEDDLLDVVEALEQTMMNNGNNPDPLFEFLPGFNNLEGNKWIYPTNYPVRNYQFNIVKTCLFKNTLVSLPTGLGKTFIAAVVMYNFYRWYPKGKIIFLAPTKPLVAQQINACYKIMGIPLEHQVEITGSTIASNKRVELWKSKRVFFMTPQCINNDLTRGICPVNDVKCIVFDEAHRAMGNHAYCQVVQQLQAYGTQFRTIALSATPGTDLNATQQIIQNLMISKIEFRSEDAIDIQPYTHARKVQKIVVKLSAKMMQIKEKYLEVVQVFINSLAKNDALYNKNVNSYTKYALLMARDRFRKDPPPRASKTLTNVVEGDFAICLSMYHGLELLLQHGMKSFFIFIKGLIVGSKGNSRTKSILQSDSNFKDVFDSLQEIYGENPDSVVHFTQVDKIQRQTQDTLMAPKFYSHPKIKKLEEVLLKHFQLFNAEKDGAKQQEERLLGTRAMVFCQYRETVYEITELLQTHKPLFRPMQFVGHAGSASNEAQDIKQGTSIPTTKKRPRFTQKDQLMVVEKFRNGNYNILVSTCVGEEGLDIGDVDLIVCFDSHKSPIRLVQRMGRTGRKRDGKIVMLVTEGKEERDYNSSVASRLSIHKAINGSGGRSLQYYQHNPRMIPQQYNPLCEKVSFTIPELQDTKKRKTMKQNTLKKFLKNDEQKQNRTFLTATQTDRWKEDLFLTQRSREVLVKKLRRKPVVVRCLEKESKPRFQTEEEGSEFSLTEWLPWQCRLKETSSLVQHSTKTKMFSEVVQFCDDVKNKSDVDLKAFLVPYEFHDKNNSKITTNKKATNNSKIPNVLEMMRKKNKQKLKVEQQVPIFISSDEDDDFEVVGKTINKSEKSRMKWSVGSRSCSTKHENDKKFEDKKFDTELVTKKSMKSSLSDKLTNLFPDLPGFPTAAFAPDRITTINRNIPTPPPETTDENGEDIPNVLLFIECTKKQKVNDNLNKFDQDSHSVESLKVNKLKKSSLVNSLFSTPTCDVTVVKPHNLGGVVPDETTKDVLNSKTTDLIACVGDSMAKLDQKEESTFDLSADLFASHFESNHFDIFGCEFEEIENAIEKMDDEPVAEVVEEEVVKMADLKDLHETREENRNLFSDMLDKNSFSDKQPPVAKVRPLLQKKPEKKPPQESCIKIENLNQKEFDRDEWGDDDDEDYFKSIDFSHFSALKSKKLNENESKDFENETKFLSPPPFARKKKRMKVIDSPASPLTNKFMNHLESRKQSTPKMEQEKTADKKRPQKRVHRRLNVEFVEDEASLSGSASEDEDLSDDCADEEMLRFVNNATQLTQMPTKHGNLVNETAMYLKSIRNEQKDVVPGNANKYKLAFGVGHDIDVFSQQVDRNNDESDYIEDSFCVDEDEDEGEGESTFDDVGDVTCIQSSTQIIADENKFGRLITRKQKVFSS